MVARWQRLLGITLSIVLVLGANFVASTKLAPPPVAHANTTWSGASAAGSGAAPWETFTGMGIGAGHSLSVNLANGNLLLETDGLSLPQMNGMDLSVLPLFNSISKSVSTDMGNGWLMGTGRDVGLVVTTSSATFYDETGHSYVFAQPTFCSFTPPPGIDAQLACSGSNYTLTDNRSQSQLQFNANGYLTGIRNREGNLITFTYDSSNRLSKITGPIALSSQQFTLSYDSSNRVTKVADATNRAWQYAYNGSNQLITITDPASHQTQFSFDGSGNLIQITDPNGNRTLVRYAPGAGNPAAVTQIVEVTNPSLNTGPTWTFSYGSPSSQSVITPGSATCGTPPSSGTSTATLTPTQVTDPNGHTRTFWLDANGRLTNLTHPDTATEQLGWTSDHHVAVAKAPSGATSAISYDANNNLTQVTLPTGACAFWQYAAPGQPYLPSSFTDDLGNTSSFQYDSKGLLTTITDALGHTSSIAYNPTYGVVNSVTDANSHVTSYGYNSLYLPIQITYPSPRPVEYLVYDSHNLLKDYTDGTAHLTSYLYDSLDQPTQITYAHNQVGQTQLSYAYDPNGNVTSLTDTTGTTSWTYNALDQPTQKTLPNANTVSYTWDGVDNLLTKTDGGGQVSYGYTVNDELSTVTDPQNKQTVLSYDQDGNQTRIAYPNGISENMSYDAAGQLTSVAASGCPIPQVCPSFSYSYTNPANNQPTTQRYSRTDANNRTQNYSYDVLNRLTQAVEKDSGGATTNSWSYAYDPVGNITSQTLNGSTTAMTYNAADQLTAAGSTTFTFNGNGNLTSSSAGASLSYNPADQTTSIKPSGGSAVAMAYTGEGQTQRTAGGSTSYQYDETGIGAATTGGATTYFTNGPDGELISERLSSGTYYYLFDGLGSVVALTDANGNIVNAYSYDPYGNAYSVTETVSNPFRFAGAIWDAGTGLYKMGERYYDPSVGRFTQPDPFDGQDYTYVAGNPVNLVDPIGLAACEESACMPGGGGGEGCAADKSNPPTPVPTLRGGHRSTKGGSRKRTKPDHQEANARREAEQKRAAEKQAEAQAKAKAARQTRKGIRRGLRRAQRRGGRRGRGGTRNRTRGRSPEEAIC